jgi:hypothetical protein
MPAPPVSAAREPDGHDRTFLSAQQRQRVAAHVRGRVQVGAQHARPLVGRGGVERRAAGPASRDERDAVERAERAGCLVDGRTRCVGIRELRLDADEAVPGRERVLHGAPLRGLAVAQRDARSLVEQQPRHGLP